MQQKIQIPNCDELKISITEVNEKLAQVRSVMKTIENEFDKLYGNERFRKLFLNWDSLRESIFFSLGRLIRSTKDLERLIGFLSRSI